MPTWVNRKFYAAGWLTETRDWYKNYRPRFGTIDKGGVYAWYGDGVLTYIGSSERLDDRIGQYFVDGSIEIRDDGTYNTKWGVFVELDLKVRMARYFGEWATLELRLIRRLKPRGNIRSKYPRKKQHSKGASASPSLPQGASEDAEPMATPDQIRAIMDGLRGNGV